MCLWKSLKQIFWFKDKVVLERHQYCKRLTRTVLVLSLIISSLTQTTKLQERPLPSGSSVSAFSPYLPRPVYFWRPLGLYFPSTYTPFCLTPPDLPSGFLCASLFYIADHCQVFVLYCFPG